MYLTSARPASLTRGRVAGTVVVLGTVSLITDISAEMVTAVLPLYLVAGLGLSPLQFGFLDGLYTGATALARIGAGHFADRWQRHKTVAAFGYGLSAIAKLFLGLASLPLLVAAIVTDRAGKGIRTAPRDALISLASRPSELGRAFGVHRAMDSTGALLGPLVAFGVLWYTSGSYNSVFFGSFCIAVIGVLTLVMFVPSPVRSVATPSLSWRPLFSSGPFRRICTSATLLGLVTIGDGFVYLLLQQRTGLPAVSFPLLPLGSALTYLTLAVPLGRLSDRLGRFKTFLAGYSILALLYLMLLGPVSGLPLVIAGLALLGTFYAATDGVLTATASAVLPESLRSSGLAVLATGQSLARLVASVAFGALWAAWTPRTALAVFLLGFAIAITVAATRFRSAL